MSRPDPGPFSDDQIALLQTFADQAVIAIENVRLFKELEARNKTSREALERQTATAEILRAIASRRRTRSRCSRGSRDSASGCSARGSVVSRCDGELVRVVAAVGGLPGSGDAMLERWRTPRPIDADGLLGRTIIARAIQQVADVETDASVPPALRENARERGWRSTIQMPMLRGDDVVGVIGVSRESPVPSRPRRSRYSRRSPTRRSSPSRTRGS